VLPQRSRCGASFGKRELSSLALFRGYTRGVEFSSPLYLGNSQHIPVPFVRASVSGDGQFAQAKNEQVERKKNVQEQLSKVWCVEAPLRAQTCRMPSPSDAVRPRFNGGFRRRRAAITATSANPGDRSRTGQWNSGTEVDGEPAKPGWLEFAGGGPLDIGCGPAFGELVG
jgi:hypothetical protein